MDHDQLKLQSRFGSAARDLLCSRAQAAVLTVCSAVVWALCFERQSLLLVPFAALVCWLAPVLYSGPGRLSTRFLVGLSWLHGTLFWWLSIPWIVPTLVQFGSLAQPLSWLLMTLLAAYLGVYHALFAFAARRASASATASRRLVWWALPGLWVLLEWLRGWLLTGFPWNLAGYSVIDVPGVLSSSALWGATGWSALVVLSNLVLARWWAQGFTRSSARAVVALAVGLALVCGIGSFVAGDSSEIESPPAAVFAKIVQPNTGIDLEVDAIEVTRNLARLAEQSQCPEPGALVVWPESAAWPFVYERDPRLRRVVQEVTDAGCALLMNSARSAGEETFNTGLLASPDGSVQTYDKTHLVPFGETVPLVGSLPFVGTLARNAGSFAAGEEVALLRWRTLDIGVSICFEITFPAEVSQRVAAGATVLATLTNDAWYGDSSAPWQHLRAARFRAAENRRTVLRAAITGVSAVIDPFGRLQQTLALDEAGILETAVTPRAERTPYSRFPGWVEIAAAGSLLAGFLAGRREQQSG